MTLTKEQVIDYFMSLKDDIVLNIDDTLYTDLNNLNYKLQSIKNNMDSYLQKEAK